MFRTAFFMLAATADNTTTYLYRRVDNGDLVKVDARELLDVKELSTVIVKGKANRDEAGNLTILASGVYVKK